MIEKQGATVKYLTTRDDVKGFALDTDYTIIDVNEPTFAEADDRVTTFNQFKKWFTKVLNVLPEGGTLGLDTATELDDLVQAATLEEVRVHKYKGKTDADEFQPAAFDYGKRNDMMDRIYTAPLQRRGINAVFVNKSKPEYAGKEATGRQIMAGWGGTTGAVQVQLHQYKEKGVFRAKIEYCRMAPEFEGTELENPTFADLAELLS